MKLSVIINTKNAAKTLAQCLKSVSFADEIVIVDMISIDDTVKIAKKFTKKIYNHKDVGYVEPARNFAISKAKGYWVLIVDSDEEVPISLQREIKKIVKSDNSTDAYFIPRKNIIFGKWIKKTGWWPDYHLRLFRKGTVTWPKQIHAVPKLKTRQAQKLPAKEEFALLHHNYQNISQFLERLNRYTSIEANLKKDKQSSIKSNQLIKAFTDQFLSRLFEESGIDEGAHGVSLSLLQANYQLITLLKVWEQSGFKQSADDQSKIVKSLRQFQKDLNYWIADRQIKNSKSLNKVYWMIRRKFKI
ncbi:MAG: glycosyltransferase family 2 protein [Candidatus Woesebacteria bacterium]|jgi:glycosyltransferase involved in cell wall biosynthesis